MTPRIDHRALLALALYLSLSSSVSLRLPLSFLQGRLTFRLANQHPRIISLIFSLGSLRLGICHSRIVHTHTCEAPLYSNFSRA